MGGAGIIYNELGNAQINRTSRTWIDVTYGLFGLSSAIWGSLQLLLPSEEELAAREFDSLPERTDEEVNAKIARGEALLRSLVDKAGIWHVFAYLYLGDFFAVYLMFVAGWRVFFDWGSALPQPAWDTYTLEVTAIVYTVLSLIFIFFEQPAEREWRIYKNWRNYRDVCAGPRGGGLEVRLAPTAGGLALKILFY